MSTWIVKFRDKAVPSLPPASVSLADEAEAFVGDVDAHRAETISELEGYLQGLLTNIDNRNAANSRDREAIAIVNEMLGRERAAQSDDQLAAEAAVDEALAELGDALLTDLPISAE